MGRKGGRGIPPKVQVSRRNIGAHRIVQLGDKSSRGQIKCAVRIVVESYLSAVRLQIRFHVNLVADNLACVREN